jgi:hypothetical protein
MKMLGAKKPGESASPENPSAHLCGWFERGGLRHQKFPKSRYPAIPLERDDRPPPEAGQKISTGREPEIIRQRALLCDHAKWLFESARAAP